MNLLLINYEFPPVGGGAANATWELARALVQLGHHPSSSPLVLGTETPPRRPRASRSSKCQHFAVAAKRALRSRWRRLP